MSEKVILISIQELKGSVVKNITYDTCNEIRITTNIGEYIILVNGDKILENSTASLQKFSHIKGMIVEGILIQKSCSDVQFTDNECVIKIDIDFVGRKNITIYFIAEYDIEFPEVFKVL